MSIIKVLYEDNHIIAVLKPAGMLTQGDKSGDVSLFDEVKKYLKKCDIYYFAMVVSEECLCVWDINSASFDDNEFKVAQEVN